MEALGKLGEHASPHAGAMAALLVDGHVGVRIVAVEALGKLGEHASPHAGAMVALLVDGDTGVRRAAVEALGRLGVFRFPCTKNVNIIAAAICKPGTRVPGRRGEVWPAVETVDY